MDIKLKNGEILDFKPDFKLSLTLNNPMLTEQGSMSLPVVLPESNRRKLGFPDRLDHTYKIKQVFNTVIGAGSYQKPALLRTTSHNKGTIGAFYLNESEMYAKMKEVDLSQAFNIIRPASDFHVDGVFAEPLDMVIKYMELVMVGNIEDDFYLFPVAVDPYKISREYSFSRPPWWGNEYTVTMHNVLNEYISTTFRNNMDYWADYDLNGNIYNKLAGRSARSIRNGDNEVDVPKGYGITPFLKQSYVLRRIFAFFGYELRESLFDTDPEMAKIVVINNTADSIVRGELNYAHLVPSGTINEYLESVRTDYGCEFFISADHKSVEVKFWNDLIMNKNFIPLDGKATGKHIPNYADSKLLKLTNSRGIEGASINFDTQEKFEKNFGALGYIKEIPVVIPNDTGFYFVQRENCIYECYITETGHKSFRQHSAYLFDYYEDKEDAEYDAHESNREYTPMIKALIRFTDNSEPPEDTNYDIWYQNDIERMPFIGTRRHLNTVLEATDGSTTETQKDDMNSCPIMTAFFRGKKEPVNYRPDPFMDRVYGNTFMYTNDGEPVPDGFNLIFGGENGLYNKFWKLYASVIRHSFHQVDIPLKFDMKDILTFRFDNVYLYKGQPLIPEKLEFEIEKDNSIKVISALFRTIRLYLDS
ncbi:MAG: hypothetical protein LBS20_10785 [Prevotella sp.]|jgi:hypothetical protein|nr:hypothetical protein [Prevotella sp.]